MARGWAGFSEEELRRLKQTKDPFEPQRRLPLKKSRQQLQREKALQEQSQKLGLQDGSALLPPEQLLSTSKPRFNSQKPNSSPPAPPSPLSITSPIGDGKQQGIESQPRELGLENSHDVQEKVEALPSKPNCKLEKKKMELQEKSRWEVLQQEQRLMEEKNKRKKALLAKAIAERSKRTQAETVKLKRIQKELQALDDMVSADIGILRNRIDQASLDYSYARPHVTILAQFGNSFRGVLKSQKDSAGRKEKEHQKQASKTKTTRSTSPFATCEQNSSTLMKVKSSTTVTGMAEGGNLLAQMNKQSTVRSIWDMAPSSARSVTGLSPGWTTSPYT
ncbi:RAB6-interacting golgin isoform X3 [Tamandua tetradactyla]|uniref:RAB6-interacting golgin isoform X3 n=1 Tax=Tamandua tetradactyla TaxID=48850 RepID=UPI004053E5DC